MFDKKSRIKFVLENAEVVAGEDNDVISSWIVELMACHNDKGVLQPSRSAYDYLKDKVEMVEVKSQGMSEGRIKFSGLNNKYKKCDTVKLIDKVSGRSATIPHDVIFEKEDGKFKYITKAGIFENTPGHKNNELWNEYLDPVDINTSMVV